MVPLEDPRMLRSYRIAAWSSRAMTRTICNDVVSLFGQPVFWFSQIPSTRKMKCILAGIAHKDAIKILGSSAASRGWSNRSLFSTITEM